LPKFEACFTTIEGKEALISSNGVKFVLKRAVLGEFLGHHKWMKEGYGSTHGYEAKTASFYHAIWTSGCAAIMLENVRWQLFSKRIIGFEQILCDGNEKYSRYGKPVRNGSL